MRYCDWVDNSATWAEADDIGIETLDLFCRNHAPIDNSHKFVFHYLVTNLLI